MNSKNFSIPGGLLSTLYCTIVVLLGGWLHVVPLALFVMVAAEAYRLYRRGYFTREGLVHFSPVWLMGISSVVFVGLQPRLFSQVILALAYGVWRWWLIRYPTDEKNDLAVAGVTELVGLSAIFLGAAVWHWPAVVTVALAWGVSWLVATRALESYDDRSAPVLIAAWGLVVAESAWVFSLWLVTYIVFNGVILLPQAAVVLTALGYCLSGIYFSHRRNRLSRTRLAEYLVVGLILMVIVIAGTKWNGVI